MLSKYRRFYGDSDAELMAMSARRFFVYLDNIHKLEAEENVRFAGVAAAGFSGDKDYMEAQFDIIGRGKEKKPETNIATLSDLGLGYINKTEQAMAQAFTKVE